MPRPLPTPEEAARILAAKRTRPAFRAAPPAGKALTPLIKALDEKFGKGAEGLKARWREIVGERLASRTEPVKLVKGRGGAGGALELKVDGALATLVQHAAPEILERVNLFLGPGSVDKLRIVQGPLRPAARRADPAATVKARRQAVAPLDAAEEARLQAELAAAPDGPLKAALLKLGREVMRRSPRR